MVAQDCTKLYLIAYPSRTHFLQLNAIKLKNMQYPSLLYLLLVFNLHLEAQQVIPFDTSNWDIRAQGYILENLDGQNAIYLSNGSMVLKDRSFVNGTIEYDIRMTERRGFYGIRFRITDPSNAEEFYFRPHQSGNPDANQATPVVNGLSGWQLYFGGAYSVPFEYPFERWMHVKLVIQQQRAQIYLDGSEKPNLSWQLKHQEDSGALALTSNLSPIHYANFVYQPDVGDIVDFEVAESPSIEGIIEGWEVSDKFEEQLLDDWDQLDELIEKRVWKQKLTVEENNAVNLAWANSRYDGTDKNTVFARLTIQASRDVMKEFHFGYSDRVVALLNGQPIYRGTNRFNSRDYRYLGTIGLFDAIYLQLKEGDNTLLLAVSEDFGGWGVTGKFTDTEGISIK